MQKTSDIPFLASWDMHLIPWKVACQRFNDDPDWLKTSKMKTDIATVGNGQGRRLPISSLHTQWPCLTNINLPLKMTVSPLNEPILVLPRSSHLEAMEMVDLASSALTAMYELWTTPLWLTMRWRPGILESTYLCQYHVTVGIFRSGARGRREERDMDLNPFQEDVQL